MQVFSNICVVIFQVRSVQRHMLRKDLSANILNLFHLAVNSDTKHLLLFSNFPTLMMRWTLENPKCRRGQPDLPQKTT